MEKEIKIDSININIGKRELSLSMDECKKLHSVLSDLFGEKVVYRNNYWWYPTWQNAPLVTYTSGGAGGVVAGTGAGNPAANQPYTVTITNSALSLAVNP